VDLLVELKWSQGASWLTWVTSVRQVVGLGAVAEGSGEWLVASGKSPRGFGG